MSRLADARASLVEVLESVVPDRTFTSWADSGDTRPAVYPDALAITDVHNAAAITITAQVVIVVDGDTAAAIHTLDDITDELWTALFLAKWRPDSAVPETWLSPASDPDTPAGPPAQAYRITCSLIATTNPA